MSTIKASNIQNGSSSSVNIALNTDGSATFAQMPVGPSYFTNRNKIINGAMEIDQRNGGASITQAGGQYSVDRWLIYGTVNSKFAAQQNAGGVTPPTGYRSYLGITSLSAYSVLAADQFVFLQSIEGNNIVDLAWGTSGAIPVTLSFWVRSSLTGAFGGSLMNSAFNRSYPFSFTINVSNTWERKTITIPGDITGTWLTDTSAGIRLYFNMGSGSNFTGPANTWASATYVAPTGSTSIVGTNGATFYVTGTQLEAGSSATPFERRNYQQELDMCQRYYENVPITVITAARGLYENTAFYKVEKRVNPTLTVVAGSLNGAVITGLPYISYGGTAAGVSGFRQNTNPASDSDAIISASAEI